VKFSQFNEDWLLSVNFFNFMFAACIRKWSLDSSE